jgi:polyisoprenoid-binding protein YceI
MNNRLILLLAAVLIASCKGKYRSDAQKISVGEVAAAAAQPNGDTLKVNMAASVIRWKGTKMRGTRKHEGVVRLRQAYFLADGGRITSGKFTVDMRSLEVTDIPAHENVPRQNLDDHLKSADFFDIQKYPLASFDITAVKYLPGDSLAVTGNLSIKDVGRNIAFGALRKEKFFFARFSFDRFLWNITYEGNLVERTLVDRDIELAIRLVLE